MADWDKGAVYYSDIFGGADTTSRPDAHNVLEKKYLQFFELFRVDDAFVYRYVMGLIGRLLAYHCDLGNSCVANCC
jgi:hypothetical protein